MRRNFTPVIIVVLLAVAVGIFITLWVTRAPEEAPVAPIVQETPAEPPAPPTRIPKPRTETAETAPPVQPDGPQVTADNWEDILTDILGSDSMDEDEKADKIADMIPNLPEAAQKELAEHLVNLASDEKYAKSAEILKNEKTPASVSDVLLSDLFNRDDELKMPIILDLAKNENHPMKDEARKMLGMIIQEDYGTDWDKWTEAVNSMLKGETP